MAKSRRFGSFMSSDRNSSNISKPTKLSLGRPKILQNPCQSLGAMKGVLLPSSPILSSHDRDVPFGAWVTGGLMDLTDVMWTRVK